MTRLHAYGVLAVFLACIALSGCAQPTISVGHCHRTGHTWWHQHDCVHAAWIAKQRRDF